MLLEIFLNHNRMVAAKRSNAAVAVDSAPSIVDNMDSMLSNSAKKTRIMFSTAYSQAAMDEQERYLII